MSMHAKNLLVELFVEELPPKALKKLGEAFGAGLLQSLRASGLAGEGSALNVFATPRRLALHCTRIRAKAPDRAQQAKLMPVAVGLDSSGRATPALLKKLASMGLGEGAVTELKRQGQGKSESLVLDTVAGGSGFRAPGACTRTLDAAARGE